MIVFFNAGLLFYFGTVILRDNPEVKLLHILYAIMTIIWSGWYAGNNFYFMPDVAQAKESAMNIFQILDEEDEDQQQIR